jgi:hypothetical protein
MTGASRGELLVHSKVYLAAVFHGRLEHTYIGNGATILDEYRPREVRKLHTSTTRYTVLTKHTVSTTTQLIFPLLKPPDVPPEVL